MKCDACGNDTSYEGYLIKQGAGMRRHYCSACHEKYHDPETGMVILYWCFPKLQSSSRRAIK